MEEDAGKSVHDRIPGATAVDLNRAGTPLVEIVKPDNTTVRADTPEGMHLFRVVELGDGVAILDGNHPLAGKTLYFEVLVESVREATDGERGMGVAG